MGQQRDRLLKFLCQHPTCAFCGGSTPATTRDHIPSRSLFVGRQWPEGYEFPACESCNGGSASDEAIIAVCSRLNPGRDPTAAERAEWLRQLHALEERHPGEARKMLLTANQKRKALKRSGLEQPERLAFGELPVLQLTPFIRNAITRFTEKLTLALHYKHTGTIVPCNAWRYIEFWTNVHKATGEIPDEIFRLIPRSVELKRGKVPVNDQFNYQYGVSNDGTMGAYGAAFRQSFFSLGLLVFDPSLMRDIDESLERDTQEVSSNEEQRAAT